MGWQTHGAECKALAAGAGVSSGTSSLDGSGAPPVATGVRAGAFVVPPLGPVGGSVGVVLLEQSTRLGSPNPLGSTRPIGVGFLVVFLERSIRLGSPLRSILRSGEGVFHPSMTCARVPCGRREVTGSM